MAAMASVLNSFCRLVNLNKNISKRCSTYTIIKDVLYKKPNDYTQIKGWIKSSRKMKDVIFLDVEDGSCARSLQVVVAKDKRPASLGNGCSISVRGKVSTNSNNQIEIKAEDIKVVGSSDLLQYPFSSKQKHTHDYCRQYLHLRPKLAHFKSLLRVRHRATSIIHNWFDTHDFTSIHTPILTSNDCEGAGEIFQVLPVSQQLINEMKKKNQPDAKAFFNDSAYLSVSGQLHLEAITRGFCKVYSFSPTFRAENSKSRLHLSEFYMVESEEAFIENISELLDTMESFVKDVIQKIITECSEDLAVILKYDSLDIEKHIVQLEKIVNNKFIRMTFNEACDILEKNKNLIKTEFSPMDGLSKEHEILLVELHGQIPIFVYDWPKEVKPFYMKTSSSNSNLVSAVDLLVSNVGELCGGSLREDNSEVLEKKLIENNLLESMQWYLDIRKFGNVPTAGFGMGFERFLQLVTGITNIKDTIPYPRWPHSLKM